MQKHEHYEQLCALAASGQLSESEERELAEHTENCGDCRAAYEDFSDLLKELPPLEDAVDLVALRQAEEEEYRKGFVARARREGCRFSPEAEQGRLPGRTRWRIPRPTITPQWATVAAMIGVGVVALAYVGRTNSGRPSSLASPSFSAQGLQSSEGTIGPSRGEFETQLEALRASVVASDRKIELLRTEDAALQNRLQLSGKNLETTRSGKERIEAELVQANELNEQLQNQTKQNAVLLSETQDELNKLRGQRADALVDLALERKSVEELSSRLKSQTESLDREKELLSAGRDITELMGARSLHVVDVYDGDGTGKNRRSYGRVFYTEGKSLIFYAFDLDERKVVNAKYSYKAWGERQANPSSVKSLGIFYVDDQALKRWALKVSDPQQLSEIDSVFVTLEPHDNGDKPHGQKLLFAFLGNTANHP
jgi:hypothetical protein